MSKLGISIVIDFHEGVTLDQAMEMVDQCFSHVRVHCVDCYIIHSTFREAWRGFMIGKGDPIFINSITGKPVSRVIVTTFEDIIAREGQLNEISFVFNDMIVYATVGKLGMRIKIASRDSWTLELISYIKNILFFKKVEIIEVNWKGEINLFYTDLAQRLEEGDFEGGEERSRYKPIERSRS